MQVKSRRTVKNRALVLWFVWNLALISYCTILCKIITCYVHYDSFWNFSIDTGLMMLHGYWFNVVCILVIPQIQGFDIFKITSGHTNRNSGPPIRVRDCYNARSPFQVESERHPCDIIVKINNYTLFYTFIIGIPTSEGIRLKDS